MAAGILQGPGKKLGPCRSACKHRDCVETREQAASPCRFCQKAIGYETRFYRSGFSGDLAHGVCLEEAVEKNDARVGLFG